LASHIKLGTECDVPFAFLFDDGGEFSDHGLLLEV
jgi:hypothetical protein